MLFLSFLCWVRWRNVSGFIVFGVLAVLSRAEAVILMAMFSGLFLLVGDGKQRMRLPEAAIALAVFVGTYVINNMAHGSYPWSTLFYYSFIGKLAYPGTEPPGLTGTQYLYVLYTNLGRIGEDARLVPMLLISAAALWCARLRPPEHAFWPALLVVMWTNYGLRYLLFPAWDEFRYYYITWVFVLMAAVELIPPVLREIRRRWDSSPRSSASSGRPRPPSLDCSSATPTWSASARPGTSSRRTGRWPRSRFEAQTRCLPSFRHSSPWVMPNATPRRRPRRPGRCPARTPAARHPRPGPA